MTGIFDEKNWFVKPIKDFFERQHILGSSNPFEARSYDTYIGDTFHLDEFILNRLKGRSIGNVCDYGSGSGYNGFLITEALDARQLTLMDWTTNGQVPQREQKLVDNSNRIDFVPVDTPSTFPDVEKEFDVIMANDVFGFIPEGKVVSLLESMGGKLSKNGMGVIVVTDNSRGQKDRLLQHYEKVKEEAPHLLEKFVFIGFEEVKHANDVTTDKEVILERGVVTDLGTQLKIFHENKKNDHTFEILEERHDK